jgi:hypothetical protein
MALSVAGMGLRQTPGSEPSERVCQNRGDVAQAIGRAKPAPQRGDVPVRHVGDFLHEPSRQETGGRAKAPVEWAENRQRSCSTSNAVAPR